MTRATIFYCDEVRLAGDAACFGVRFDAQMLPTGSVVVGFMTGNQELLAPPAMSGEQAQNYAVALSYARSVLANEPPLHDGTYYDQRERALR